jgi:sugar phosphate isomerase/epimerase
MMSGKSRNTENPKYSKLVVGVCPDQWGVWFAEDDKQIEPRQAMKEMAEAGFEILETGPWGYFPTDPKELTKWTDEFGFKVVSGTGWGILHKKEAWPETERHFREMPRWAPNTWCTCLRCTAMIRRGNGRMIVCWIQTPGSSTSKTPTSWDNCCLMIMV